MDGGPFRTPQPTDRRAPNRPESAYRPPDEPQLVSEDPRVSRSSAPYPEVRQSRFKKRFILPIIIALIIVLASAGGWFAWTKSQQSKVAVIDSSKYQAVFFTNGQVYFGKLQEFNGQYLKLTEIYYLQTQTQSTTDTTSQNPQKTTADNGNNVQLIKLGQEIHGPEDAMIIARDQVLFFENLKPDGKVAQSIEKFKKQ